MTRTILATAALAAATALASTSAQACLSCEYVPEVVKPHATSPLAYGRGDNEVSHRSSSSYSSVKRRIAKSVDEPRQEKFAKAQKAEMAKVAKADTNDSPKPAKVAKAEPIEKVEKKAEKTIAKVETENSSVTLASNADLATNAKAPVEETTATTAAKTTDCKKFFASVGMTLSVPCE